ncbi:MAG: hypothetical protein FRX48_08663 [Lasallia pustulata]|uniref:Retroviral polymerase SH3-like domain-containing protein n=1 Tax=Lasallia pustulata TaxID=136370 RepID=A0A5M8PEX1_9LECA|nr:MAG: hypothetical protein FRX48_08663 [Lasallia pustulata]
MIGYGEGHNQYHIYNPKKQAVLERRDVKFHEGRNLIPVGDNGGNPTLVEDNNDQTESESDLDMGYMQREMALLSNTLRGEDLGHITTPKRRFDHNSPASCEQPQNDNLESRSEGGVVPINIENNNESAPESAPESAEESAEEEGETEEGKKEEEEEDLALDPETTPPQESPPLGPRRLARNIG